MRKLGRTMLWLIPFTWPIALWRSIKAGQEKRQHELVVALGGQLPAKRRGPVGWALHKLITAARARVA